MNRIIFNPPRPELTDEMRYAAALEFARDNPTVQVGIQAKQIAKEIAACDVDCWTNAYELAKELESYHDWDVGADTVATLDNYDIYLRKHLKAAEKQWAEDNNIQPPFPIGTVVQFYGRRTGEITSISKYDAAAYEIKEEGKPENYRAIVKFENCLLPEKGDK